MSDNGNPTNAPGSNYHIQNGCKIPLIDAHMHIQSNDIAPLPIMLAIPYFTGAKKVAIWTRLIKKLINYHELSFRENTKFPANDNISPERWTSESALGNMLTWIAGDDRRSITDSSAGDGFFNTIKLFFAGIKDYGKVARHTSFNIAGIYLNDLWRNSMGIASHRIKTDPTTIGDPSTYDDSESKAKSEDERKDLIESRIKTLGNFQRILDGYYEGERTNIQGGFEFSVVLGMELMYAHYWGAYGIPIYIYHKEKEKLYFVCNDLGYIATDSEGNKTTKVCHNAYDIQREALNRNYKIYNGGILQNESTYKPDNTTDFFNAPPLTAGSGDSYKHYLIPTELEEVVQYEDFVLHLEYTRMAAIKAPFRLLPFYHFDPRRFFSPDINLNQHNFYITEKNPGENMLTQVDTSKIKNIIDSNFPFHYKMEEEKDLKDELLTEGNSTGLFWGIKMYAALGYPPYLYDTAERKKIYTNMDGKQYSGLLSFFQYCAKNNIPITCHGSPQGMTIADPGVYLKQYLKQQNKSDYFKDKTVNFPAGRVQFIQGLGLIDDFSSPMSWRKVLKKLGKTANSFRLCIAHYGGSDFLSGEFDDSPESPYCWHEEIRKLIHDYKQVYTDLSCYTIEEIPDLLPTISPREYNDYKGKFPVIEKIYRPEYGDNREHYIYISSFRPASDEEKAQVLALRLEMIERNKTDSLYKKTWSIASKIAGDLRKDGNGRLRYRMMFGTDWPMSEMGVTGATNYTACMFIILQLVTKLTGAGQAPAKHWDAWHQFTVINPLRFLGLIEEQDDEDSREKLSFIPTRLEQFKKHLENYLNDDKKITSDNIPVYEKKYAFDREEDRKNIEKKYDSLMRDYKDNKIPTASSEYMRKGRDKNGRLKILGMETT